MWNRHKIIEKLKVAADRYGSDNPQQLKQLTFSCNNSPEEEVFFGLFSFFYDESLQKNKFERQQLSGRVLFKVLPSPSLALDGSVYAAAKIWDYSVEELPWYWCKAYGKEKVIEFLKELLPDCADDEMKKSFKTMLFWCERYKDGA